MIKADKSHKNLVIDILCQSFDNNKSVNWTIKQDRKRHERIKYLAEYSFETCLLFGAVYLSSDQKACALLLFPEQKKTKLKTILLDLKLAIKSIGVERVLKVLNKETLLKSFHPKKQYVYLWFIGVYPEFQKQGIGSSLLREIIENYRSPICLETSASENVPWYISFGFKVYKELDDFGYKTSLMANNFE